MALALALRNQTARGGPAAGRAPFWGKLIRFPRRVAREHTGIWPHDRLSTFRDRLSRVDFPGSIGHRSPPAPAQLPVGPDRFLFLHVRVPGTALPCPLNRL